MSENVGNFRELRNIVKISDFDGFSVGCDLARSPLSSGVHGQFVGQLRTAPNLDYADERPFSRRGPILARPQYDGRSFVRLGH